MELQSDMEWTFLQNEENSNEKKLWDTEDTIAVESEPAGLS